MSWATGLILTCLLLVVVAVGSLIVNEDKVTRRIRKQEAARLRWAEMMATDIERSCMYRKEQQ